MEDRDHNLLSGVTVVHVWLWHFKWKSEYFKWKEETKLSMIALESHKQCQYQEDQTNKRIC